MKTFILLIPPLAGMAENLRLFTNEMSRNIAREITEAEPTLTAFLHSFEHFRQLHNETQVVIQQNQKCLEATQSLLSDLETQPRKTKQ